MALGLQKVTCLGRGAIGWAGMGTWGEEEVWGGGGRVMAPVALASEFHGL